MLNELVVKNVTNGQDLACIIQINYSNFTFFTGFIYLKVLCVGFTKFDQLQLY